ncbi:hypothetical protein Nmel_011007 [Mimus melanotis]
MNFDLSTQYCLSLVRQEFLLPFMNANETCKLLSTLSFLAAWDVNGSSIRELSCCSVVNIPKCV